MIALRAGRATERWTYDGRVRFASGKAEVAELDESRDEIVVGGVIRPDAPIGESLENERSALFGREVASDVRRLARPRRGHLSRLRRMLQDCW